MSGWAILRKRLFEPWVIALVLAVGLHVLWFALMPRRGALVPPRQPLKAAGFAYLGSESRARSIQQLTHDARAAQSPTLFALPSPMGFSGPLLLGKAQHRPQGIMVDYFGTRETTPGAGGTGGGQPMLWTSLWSSLNLAPAADPGRPAESRAFPPRPPASLATIRLIGLDELDGMDAVMSARREEAALRDAKAWELSATLRFDELGAVQSVLFDKPNGTPERTLAARRLLHNYHLPPDLGIRAGRVSIRYEPGSAEAQP